MSSRHRAYTGLAASLLAIGAIGGLTAGSADAAPTRDYRWVTPAPGDTSAHAVSNVVYLNNCEPDGCTLTPGEDGTRNQSAIIGNQTVHVQPFAYSDAVWQQVVTCVKETYGDFDVQIVTERPAGGEYHTAIVAGRPEDIGAGANTGGVSPYSCSYIRNAVSFSFANLYGGSVDDICWTVAQETAHSWGLDHKFDNRDPMTYLQSGPSRKQFIDQDGACGEYSARTCGCGGESMNSYQEVRSTFGLRTAVAPTVSIVRPVNGQAVQPGFPVEADISDDVRVDSASLFVDDQLVSTTTAAPYVFNAPTSLAPGTHFVEVRATDSQNTIGTQRITIIIGDPCERPDDCPDDSQTCVQGRCVPGSGVEGGLGTTCLQGPECASGICAQNSSGDSFCVEMCDQGNDGCPSGFGCIGFGDVNDAGGVCWPGAGDGGGCSASGGGLPVGLPIGLSLAFAAVVAGRKRRS